MELALSAEMAKGDRDDPGHGDRVDNVELGQDSDVSRGLGGVQGGGEDGRHRGHAGVELGLGEHLEGDDEVGTQEAEHDEDPGPHGEERGDQADGDGAISKNILIRISERLTIT